MSFAPSLTAMFLGLVFGPWLIRHLRELQIGQFIREEGPEEHKKKAGTPTMGGVLIVLSTAVPVLLWADLTNPFILVSLFALFGFEQARPQNIERFFLVLLLAAPVLAANDRASRNVQDLHRRIGRVHPLAARSAGTANFDPKILGS